MPKRTGLGMGFYIGGVDVSGDVGSFGNISGGNAPLDMTGIDKSGFERHGGLRSGTVEYSAFHNPTGIHVVTRLLPATDQQALGRVGSNIGDAAFAMVAKQLNYDPKRGSDGSLIFGINSVSNGSGLQWGDLLTGGIRTDTAPTNGPGFDTNIGTIFNRQLYVQLLAFTGGSITIKVQESSDNGGGDPYADIPGVTATFAAAPAALAASGSGGPFDPWVRLVTTGTFTSASFVAMVASNDTPVVF